jgi:DNA-binding PadR family transcriptional regulator
MNDQQLSLTEYAVLGLLAEGPSHGFALSKDLAGDGAIGRVLTVRRPLVYRALDRLVGLGLAASAHTEPGNAGPKRVVHRITPGGKRQIRRWLGQPVQHVREMRIEFQLKLVLLQRSGKSPLSLIGKQQAALQPTFAALDYLNAAGEEPDHLELWRQHNAAAAGAYLDHLGSIYGENERRRGARRVLDKDN